MTLCAVIETRSMIDLLSPASARFKKHMPFGLEIGEFHLSGRSLLKANSNLIDGCLAYRWSGPPFRHGRPW